MDRLEVSEMACLRAFDPAPYRRRRLLVLQARTPLGEGHGLLDHAIHASLVSNTIQVTRVRYARMGSLVAMGYLRFTRTDGGGVTPQAARRSATVVIKVMGSSGDSSSPRLR